MKAEPLRSTKHNALKRIVAEKRARHWRAFCRDMKAFAIITTIALTVAGAVLYGFCAIMDILP